MQQKLKFYLKINLIVTIFQNFLFYIFDFTYLIF